MKHNSKNITDYLTNETDDINFDKVLHMIGHKSTLLEQNIIPIKSITKLPVDIRYNKIKVNDECFEYAGKYNFFKHDGNPTLPSLVTVKYSEMHFVQLNTDDMQNGNYSLKECPNNETYYALYKNDSVVFYDTYIDDELLTAMNIFM